MALKKLFLSIPIALSILTCSLNAAVRTGLDIMAAQDQIKEAVQSFKVILAAASTFDGEEVIQVG